MTGIPIQTDLGFIAGEGAAKEEENDHFLKFVQQYPGEGLDEVVLAHYHTVSQAIDCTQCGNCCQKLVVNITPEEITGLAAFLNKPEPQVRDEYIEESLAGNCYINTIPCTFLADRKCSIYSQRFTECRDFPHLHKPGFRQRLLGTLLHYGSCPIIYNVIERVKEEVGFVVRS